MICVPFVGDPLLIPNIRSHAPKTAANHQKVEKFISHEGISTPMSLSPRAPPTHKNYELCRAEVVGPSFRVKRPGRSTSFELKC